MRPAHKKAWARFWEMCGTCCNAVNALHITALEKFAYHIFDRTADKYYKTILGRLLELQHSI